MRLNEYQTLSSRTFPKDEFKDKLSNYALGLTGEAGEVADLIKKALYHGHKLDSVEIKKELGDVMHYVAGLAEFLGFTLEEIGFENIEKLKTRYPNGFSEEASRNRVI